MGGETTRRRVAEGWRPATAEIRATVGALRVGSFAFDAMANTGRVITRPPNQIHAARYGTALAASARADVG